jgi:hypothetical protein
LIEDRGEKIVESKGEDKGASCQRNKWVCTDNLFAGGVSDGEM